MKILLNKGKINNNIWKIQFWPSYYFWLSNTDFYILTYEYVLKHVKIKYYTGHFTWR